MNIGGIVRAIEGVGGSFAVSSGGERCPWVASISLAESAPIQVSYTSAAHAVFRAAEGFELLLDETGPDISAIVDGLAREGGSFAMSHRLGSEWVAALVFGREDEDSPMAGGASYAMGSAEDVVQQIISETGWTVLA